MTITIYTTPTCHYCKEAKALFNKYDLPFTEVNILEKEETKDFLREKTGRLVAPIIDVDGVFLVGYNEEILKATLHIT